MATDLDPPGWLANCIGFLAASAGRMPVDQFQSHPGGSRSVAMVATDGIFFDSRHPTLELSNRIGEWEEARRENLTLFKPGSVLGRQG